MEPSLDAARPATSLVAPGDVQSAIRFHIETFGKEAFTDDSPLLHAYVTETKLVNANSWARFQRTYRDRVWLRPLRPSASRSSENANTVRW